MPQHYQKPSVLGSQGVCQYLRVFFYVFSEYISRFVKISGDTAPKLPFESLNPSPLKYG